MSKKSTISTNDIYPDVEVDGKVFGEWKYPIGGEPYFQICGRAVWVTDVFKELETDNEYIVLKYVKDIVSGDTATATMRPTENWATTILTTGEKNILNGTKQNAGIAVRVLVFDSIKWTESAEHSERIQKGIEENYGHAILKVARYLLETAYNSISRKLEFFRKKYLEKTTINDSFTERVSKKYAVLLLTTSIAKKVLGLGFSVRRILKFIIETEANANIERDIGSKAYSLLLEFVETSPDYFSSRKHKANANPYSYTWHGGSGNKYYGVVESLKSPEIMGGNKIFSTYRNSQIEVRRILL